MMDCCLSVGCTSIDAVLGGGVWSGEVVEVWGPAASGKTQFCHALTASVVGGTGHSVAYVCASCDFTPTRLRQLLLSQQVKEVDLPAAMEKVRVFGVYNVFELLSLLHQLQRAIGHQMDSYHANLGLVVIDPVTLYLSPLLGCRSGRAMLGQVGSVLKDLAHHYQVAVVCVNNVVADMARREGGGEVGGVKAALGQFWSSVPSLRLQLSFAHYHGNQDQTASSWQSVSPALATPTTQRLLTVFMATRESSGSSQALFTITDAGLVNVSHCQTDSS